MRVVWLTDIHLNFLLAHQVSEFLATVAATGPDAVLIGGDIGESQNVCDYLERMHESIAAPSTSCWATTIIITARSRRFAARSPSFARRSAADVSDL